jgi:probable HAF family extracellular repeat protein
MIAMLFTSTLDRRMCPSRPYPRPRGCPARTRFVPRLEVLEDRAVPSAGYAFHTIDDPNAGTTGNGVQGTVAIGINASGQVSGNYGDANNVTHGYLLSHGQYTTFDDPQAGTGAGQGTSAFGINDRGQIVGEYVDANNVQHGFLRSAGGQYTTLDNPNAGTGPSGLDQAVDINARGQIVGGYTDASGVTHGYLLSGGKYTTLDDPNAGTGAGQGTSAIGINDRGQVVGLYTDANNVQHGFLLSGGRYTTIDDPNGVQTLGGMINDSGQITGTYLDANNVYHGFLLSGGQYTTLDDPNAGTGAFQGSFAYGISNSGKIVGAYLDGNSLYHGFLATAGHGDAALGSSNGAAAGSGPASTGGTRNVLVAPAAPENAAAPGTPAVSAAGTFGDNRGDGQGGLPAGQTPAVVAVPSPLRGSADSANGSGRRGHVLSATAAARKHPGFPVDAVFAGTDDLFGPITPI